MRCRFLNITANCIWSPRVLYGKPIKKISRVHVWTVNDEQDMERLLYWGVDGIITDYPDRLNRVLQKH